MGHLLDRLAAQHLRRRLRSFRQAHSEERRRRQVLRLHVVLPHRGCARGPLLDLAAELGSPDPLPRAGEPASRGGRPTRSVRTGRGASDRRHRAQRPCLDLQRRTRAEDAGAPTPRSPYRIELRDRAGRVVESAVPTTSHAHIDHAGRRPSVFMVLETTLPFAPTTAAVTLTTVGQVLARRARSVHAPNARFVAPRAGSKVGGAGTTLVRWTARDADGGPSTSTVDYSPDGGRHWKVVADRVAGQSVRVPGRFLSASRNGRCASGSATASTPRP